MKLFDYLINAAVIAVVIGLLAWWYRGQIRDEVLKGIQGELTNLENRLTNKNKQDIADVEQKSVNRIVLWKAAQDGVFAEHAPLIKTACQSQAATLKNCIAATNARDQKLHQLSPTTVVAAR